MRHAGGILARRFATGARTLRRAARTTQSPHDPSDRAIYRSRNGGGAGKRGGSGVPVTTCPERSISPPLFEPVVVGPQLQIPPEILVYVRHILGAHPPISAQLVIYGSRGVYTRGYGMADPHRCERIEASCRIASRNPSVASSRFEMLRAARPKRNGA